MNLAAHLAQTGIPMPCRPGERKLPTMPLRELPPALAATKAVQGPLRRLQVAQGRLEAAQEDFTRTRRQTVVELVDAGLSYAQIAELLGVTKSRAFQIARGSR